MRKGAPMFTLDGFVEDCRRLAVGPHGPKQVLALMREVVADPEAIAAAVPPLEKGQSALSAPLFRSADLTVLNASLGPGLVTIPHDHRMWAVVGIYEGEETNTFYRRAGEGLAEANRRSVHAGEAILLGEDIIHAIANPLARPTLGLHVYGGDLLGAPRSMWDPTEGREHPYDVAQFGRWGRDLALSRRRTAAEATAS
jgi:predicted metal-dependent enzyme (double-stranded beta helix superfamily)